ncbi:MAG TPA: HEAT repeat domain-containing protein [Bryobacteraceae bacterium]|nr:HEAT repeat domain-containing protein [Bryobacteraceae bacterium]
MPLHRGVTLLLFLSLCLAVQAQTATLRPKDVREMGKGGADAIPKLAALLSNPDFEIRLEAVKQIDEIDTQHSLDPLIQATRDSDAEIQIRATDGLVNFYLPGYLKTGFGSSLRRVGTSIKGHFTDINDQVIDPYVTPRADVIAALGALARNGADENARANAARAIGILRGKAAIPDLIQAMHSKSTPVIYESLVALQKIRDPEAAPSIAFLLRDLDPKVQVAAIETTGLLLNKSALPALVDVLNHTRDSKVRRAALTSIAMLPDPGSREIYARYIADKDEKMRAAAAEGFARLKNPADLPMLEKAYQDEAKMSPRLSMAFAQVMLGKTQISEFSPLQFLIDTLNSAAYHGVAFPFLVELARDPAVRRSLYTPLLQGTRDEKIYLARVMARSGDKNDAPQLEKLSHDPDPEVAQEGLRALKNLQART